MYYKFHRRSLNRCGSYVVFPKSLKNKKARTALKNNDDKCFQYAATAALKHKQIKKNPQRVSKIKSFIVHYNRK